MSRLVEPYLGTGLVSPHRRSHQPYDHVLAATATYDRIRQTCVSTSGQCAPKCPVSDRTLCELDRLVHSKAAMSAPAAALNRPNRQLANGPATGEQQHELRKMSPSPSRLPVEEDIMQLARLGEIGAIQKLFNSGKFDANYADAEGITPLHV